MPSEIEVDNFIKVFFNFLLLSLLLPLLLSFGLTHWHRFLIKIVLPMKSRVSITTQSIISSEGSCLICFRTLFFLLAFICPGLVSTEIVLEQLSFGSSTMIYQSQISPIREVSFFTFLFFFAITPGASSSSIYSGVFFFHLFVQVRNMTASDWSLFSYLKLL